MEEFTYSNTVTRSNLKRRVYDSINVLYASGIVERRVETINTKKEYFFKPSGFIGKSRITPDSDLLKNREAKQREVRDKLIILHKAHKQYQIQDIRYQIIKKLIQRNKTNRHVGSQPASKHAPVFSHGSSNSPPKEKIELH
jgi:isocitrate dehydrogenase kinase/phosphatase